MKKSKDKWEAYDSEVSEAETKLREMNKERESLENEGEKIVESVKNFEKEMDEVTTSLKEVKESLTKLEEYETQYKSERIEIDQANEKFAAALKENTKTIQHWRREIAKLRLVFYIIFFIIRHYKKGTWSLLCKSLQFLIIDGVAIADLVLWVNVCWVSINHVNLKLKNYIMIRCL